MSDGSAVAASADAAAVGQPGPGEAACCPASSPCESMDGAGGASEEDATPPRSPPSRAPSACWCSFCLEPADAATGVRAPCGACRGSLALVHLDCLRHDLEARRRVALAGALAGA
jgi:hypothetical protein